MVDSKHLRSIDRASIDTYCPTHYGLARKEIRTVELSLCVNYVSK